MNISVLNPGLLTTIQDLGRTGYQRFGVVVGGAMDTYATRLANILVGNEEGEGVFEITFMGPSLKLEKGTLFAITGGDFNPKFNNKPIPMGRPIHINADGILTFGACTEGCRSYVAVAGGFDIPLVMGSKSTYIRANLGGFKGRALKKGDIIPIGQVSELSSKIISKLISLKGAGDFNTLKWFARNSIFKPLTETVIRVFQDRQYGAVNEESIERFFSQRFTIDNKSDRMGYRLSEVKIELKEKLEMISEEVSFGTIQVPPDGNPIILLADRQTVGGYPKIAHVVAVDIPKIVQCKPGEKITFQKVTLGEAERLLFQRESELTQLKKTIKMLII